MLKKFKRNRSLFYRKKYMLISFVVLCVLVLMSFFGMFTFLNDELYPYTLPILKKVHQTRIATKNKIFSFIDKSELVDENNKLRGEIAEITSQITSYKDLVEENQILRDQLNIQKTAGQKMLLSDVSFKDSNIFTENVILNVGKNHGVRLGNIVMFKNVLIGEIIRVYDSISELRLVTDLDSLFSVEILGEESCKGILKGELGEESLVVSNIEKNSKISVGSNVILSRDSDIYALQANLLVGKVKEIIDIDNEAYKQAIVTPAIKYSDLDKVFVIL